jgi:hypothetical protein
MSASNGGSSIRAERGKVKIRDIKMNYNAEFRSIEKSEN